MRSSSPRVLGHERSLYIEERQGVSDRYAIVRTQRQTNVIRSDLAHDSVFIVMQLSLTDLIGRSVSVLFLSFEKQEQPEYAKRNAKKGIKHAQLKQEI